MRRCCWRRLAVLAMVQNQKRHHVSRLKQRIHNTQMDNLIANLRGEVGEVITSWVLLRHMRARERELTSGDIAKDMASESLAFVTMLSTKLADEIVARLSELAEAKIGRLTFYFAAQKLNGVDADVQAFSAFIIREKFQQKRNADISHKELPEQWATRAPLVISYQMLLRGIAAALRIMKKIDAIVLGAGAKYLWHEMRKKRYQLIAPASAMYMMLPHLKLSAEIRQRVVIEDIAGGRQAWSEMTTTINGQEVTVSVCPEWGVLLLGCRIIALDNYPLRRLASINIPPLDPSGPCGPSAEPITEQRQITAIYRVKQKEGDNQISFTPIQRVHHLGGGAVTELPDITINLNDNLREDLGQMRLGDEKEFSILVTVATGFRTPEAGMASPPG